MMAAFCRGGSRGRVQGVRTSPPPPEMTCGFLIQLVFCQKKKTLWFIGVAVEQETSAPPAKKSWIRPCFGCHRHTCLRKLSQK